MEEKEEVEKKEREETTSLRVSKKAHEMLVTLQSLRQIRERKRLSVSDVLCEAMRKEIERMEKISGGNKNE